MFFEARIVGIKNAVDNSINSTLFVFQERFLLIKKQFCFNLKQF